MEGAPVPDGRRSEIILIVEYVTHHAQQRFVHFAAAFVIGQ